MSLVLVCLCGDGSTCSGVHVRRPRSYHDTMKGIQLFCLIAILDGVARCELRVYAHHRTCHRTSPLHELHLSLVLWKVTSAATVPHAYHRTLPPVRSLHAPKPHACDVHRLNLQKVSSLKTRHLTRSPRNSCLTPCSYLKLDTFKTPRCMRTRQLHLSAASWHPLTLSRSVSGRMHGGVSKRGR